VKTGNSSKALRVCEPAPELRTGKEEGAGAILDGYGGHANDLYIAIRKEKMGRRAEDAPTEVRNRWRLKKRRE